MEGGYVRIQEFYVRFSEVYVRIRDIYVRNSETYVRFETFDLLAYKFYVKWNLAVRFTYNLL